jgi:endonuclease YncB( thermonuclease family)
MLSKVLALTLLLTTSAFAKGVLYDAKVTHLVDGDTVAIEAPWIPDPIKKEIAIRVFGVDTPEKGFRAKCESEAARGALASKFTAQQIGAALKVQVLIMDWDKYGGRMLGDIVLDGRSLRVMLIEQGFAREYFGDAKKSWCE